MSNGIKFTFLLSVILIVMFSMTFAQGVPFQAEVTVSVARMRWGPGPAYVVQHYANLGHVLTVLEADAESDPPWTWYYARTPSGVESWIRGDLIRRTDAPVPVVRVDAPTGTYPVADNNLCNTTLFRPCQDGTDHDLWEAGYWANDRYDHWEHGGWNLDIVYHQNPCKANRLCTTKEQWDAGRVEAELLAVTATPEVTLTPVQVEVTVVREQVWEVLTGDAGAQLLDRELTTGAELYTPPEWIRTDDAGGGTTLGRFEFRHEKIDVTCRFWHRVGVDADDDALGSTPRGLVLRKLRDEDGITVISPPPAPVDDSIHASRLNCREGNVGETSDVVARQWVITVTRSYAGRGRISGVSWTLKATIGNPNPEKCTTILACLDTMPSGPSSVYDYIAASRIDAGRQQIFGPTLPGGMNATGATCDLRKRTSGDSIEREHTCENKQTTNVSSTLSFNYTYNSAGGFLAPTPTPCPDTDNDGRPNC